MYVMVKRMYLEMVVNRQEVFLQGGWSAEIFPKVFDAQFRKMLVTPLHQLLHH